MAVSESMFLSFFILTNLLWGFSLLAVRLENFLWGIFTQSFLWKIFYQSMWIKISHLLTISWTLFPFNFCYAMLQLYKFGLIRAYFLNSAMHLIILFPTWKSTSNFFTYKLDIRSHNLVRWDTLIPCHRLLIVLYLLNLYNHKYYLSINTFRTFRCH